MSHNEYAYEHVEQRSPEWYALKLGKVSGSNIHKVVAKIKKGEAADRRNYRTDLLVENLTGRNRFAWQSWAMKEGIEREPAARAHYEMVSGNAVKQIGWIDHPTIADAGFSPDGLIADDGFIEIKCMQDPNHLEFYRTDQISDEYWKQIQWGFACMPKRKWCHFIAYNPEIEGYEFHWRRVHRDAELIKELEDAVPPFLKEVADEVAATRAKRDSLLGLAA